MAQKVQVLCKYVGPFLKSAVVLPSAGLRDYIDFYSCNEFDIMQFPSQHLPSMLLLPRTRVWMTFGYNDIPYLVEQTGKNFQSHSIVLGEQNIQNHYYIDKCPKLNKQIDVIFKPGGFYKFFGIYDGEVGNDCFRADEVVGNQIRCIEEQFKDLKSMGDRVRLLDRFFAERLKFMRREINTTLIAMRLIVANRGNMKVKELSKELSISNRTLERQFMNRIGLSPKEFLRVVRFKSVLNKILSLNSIDWLDLVQSHGYYDQSHLIEEFKSATTFSPQSFLDQKGKSILKFRGLLILLGDDPLLYSYRNVMEEAGKGELMERL